MQEKNTVGSINDRLAARAAGWFARLQAPDCTAAQRREFEAWLAEDDRHRQAFEAATRAAARVTDALKVDPRMRALLEAESLPVWTAPAAAVAKPRRRHRLSVATGLVAALALAVLIVPSFLGPSSSPPAVARLENTDTREKTVKLADGSLVHLDVDSLVTAELRPDARRLTLLKGRAYFEVAHDASRPFSVDAAGTRTVALGTRFEVRLRPRGVTVTLAQGSVAVTPTDLSDWTHRLSPGQQLVLDVEHPQGRLLDVDPSLVTAWSQGRLVFDGQPLAAVLEEVNRYSGIKVVLGDDRLAATPIGGTFAAGADAGAFVQALSAILPLRSEPSGDHEIVLFQRERAVTPD